MKKNKQILDEVEKTLNSFDYIQKLDGNSYLYIRIISEIETDRDSEKRRKIFSLNPVFIGLILLINILTGIFFLDTEITSNPSSETEIQSLKQDYKITQTYKEFISNN